jgi:hypothetical protein
VPRFVENLSSVVDYIGVTDVGLVWGLSNIFWENETDRDLFLEAITTQAVD